MDEQEFVVLTTDDVQDFNEDGILPLSAEKFTKVQEWLQPTDYAAPSGEYGRHRASHLPGTGIWIQHTEEYRQWHDSDQGTLWIKAVAGAGKSVIAASLVSEFVKDENTPVLHFFFRHIVSANQTPISLVRDFVSQLLRYSPVLQHDLFRLVDSHRSLESVSFDELWKMLTLTMTQLPRVYCVIDALDEMDLGNETFLQDIVSLGQQKPTSIKVLVTSRPLPQIEQVLRHSTVLQIILHPRLVDPDISIYVRHRVANLPISDKLREQIYDTMCAKADGHFLYARLMMDDLLDPMKGLISSEQDMMYALGRLPTPMADMYTQMLANHSSRSGVPQQLQVAILQWVTRAERPLRLLELSAMIDVKQRALELGKDTKSVIREACGPLLEIFEDGTVHPIHHSLTEYLYDQRRRPVSGAVHFPVLDLTVAQHVLAMTCIRNLMTGWHRGWDSSADAVIAGDREQKRKALKLKYPFLEYAAKNWHKHLSKSGAHDAATVTELDSLLCQDPKLLVACMEMADTNKRGLRRSDDRHDWNKWEPIHVAADKGILFYMEHLIEKGHDADLPSSKDRRPLALASSKGHAPIVELLLKLGISNDQDDELGLKPLHYAASHNHADVVNLLLQSGVDPFTPKTKSEPGRRCGNAPTDRGKGPLELACRSGHIEAVKAFIPYLQTEGHQRSLHWALQYGKKKLAEVLLEVPGIDVNHVIANQTPIYMAARLQDLRMIRMLLSRGADVHALSSSYVSHGGVPLGRNCYGRQISPLHAFAGAGIDAYVRSRRGWPDLEEGLATLMDAGINPNITNDSGQTLLHILISQRTGTSHAEPLPDIEHLLAFLFDRGLSATALTPAGANALHLGWAMSTTLIKMLVSRGVDIDEAIRGKQTTPLMEAVKRQDHTTARNLLACGANLHAANAEGDTVLHLYARQYNFSDETTMYEALLDAGADIHARNSDGNTALHLAETRPKVLQFLIDRGSDLESRNKLGKTVLFQRAWSRAPVDTLKLLVDAGANVCTRDSQGLTILHIVLDDLFDKKTADLLRYFVEKGADPKVTDHAGNTLWHRVATQGPSYHQKEQLAVMKILMEFDIDPTARNHAGQTPLHLAFSAPQSHYAHGPISFLLENTTANIHAGDHNLIQPIHLAAAHDASLTCQLLEIGADATVLTIEGQSPLMIACRTRQCNIVCVLLDHFRKHGMFSAINQVDNDGLSALHYACKSGRPETVALLLEAGADVNLESKHKVTPLQSCAQYHKEQATGQKVQEQSITSLVLMSDSSARPRRNSELDGGDPLRIRESIRLLVEKGADTSFLTTVPKQDYNDNLSRFGRSYGNNSNPLSDAISEGCEAMVSELLLIQEKLFRGERVTADPDAISRCEDGQNNVSNLDEVKNYWTQLLQRYGNRVRLLRMNSIPDILRQSTSQEQNSQSLIEDLLRHDDEPSVELVSKLGALSARTDIDMSETVKRMVSWGFSDLLRKVDRDAAQLSITRLKKTHSQGVGRQEKNPKSLLHTALARQIPNMAMVRLLVGHFKLDPDELVSDGSGYKPATGGALHLLGHPQYWWQTRALGYLLDSGAKIELLNSDNETPLMVALRPGYGNTYDPAKLRAIEILLERGANPNAVRADGQTCLNVAASQPEVVKLLLKHGANPSAGYQPFIFAAIRAQDIIALRLIIESGADVNVLSQPPPEPADKADTRHMHKKNCRHSQRSDSKAWSEISSVEDLCKYAYPIHVAASHHFKGPEQTATATKIIELLLDAGADPSLVYEDGNTIMHLLAEQNGIIEPFMKHPNFDLESRDKEGRTLLLATCDTRRMGWRDDNTNNRALFMQRGASITATDNKGRSALHLMISDVADSVSRPYIISSIPDSFIQTLGLVPNSDNRTPFHYAIAASSFQLIDNLLAVGADPTQPDPRDNSIALHHLAKHLPNWHDVDLTTPLVPGALVSSKFSPNPQSTQASGDKTAQRSPPDLFQYLLGRGLSINARDSNGETPLFKLMSYRSGQNNQPRHPPGTGNDRIFRTLPTFEEAGADFTVRSAAGESVLHRLAMQMSYTNFGGTVDNVYDEDFKKTFLFLVEKGADVTWEDEEHRTCLDVAAVSGAKWLTEMFERKK